MHELGGVRKVLSPKKPYMCAFGRPESECAAADEEFVRSAPRESGGVAIGWREGYCILEGPLDSLAGAFEACENMGFVRQHGHRSGGLVGR